MFDSHCHLNFPEFQSRLISDLEKCTFNGINQWMIPGINLDSLNEFKQIIERTSQLKKLPLHFYFALGLHPYFIQHHKLTDTNLLETQINTFNIQAIGETGLDATCENHTLQTQLLERHFEFAKNLNLPIILHHRQTLPELLKVAKKFPTVTGVIHAFSGSYEQAMQWGNLGYFLGVGATITYERATKTRKAIKQIDLEHLLLETDAPSMPIFGKQGEVNAPINLIEVARTLATLKNDDLHYVDEKCSNNANLLFRKR